MIFAAAAIATLGFAAPALAGEGSPDIDLGPYGNWGRGPTYPYVAEEPGAYVTAPTYGYQAAPPYARGYYEQDEDVGYAPRVRTWRSEGYDLD
jgi:hypothetical protein